MRRIRDKRESKSTAVENIIGSLTAALQELNLENDESILGDDDYLPPFLAPPFSHGDPASAMHDCLLELYGLPFASICFVAIDGEEKMYCNKRFEEHYITEEECNLRLLRQAEVPRDIIGW